MFHLHLFIIKMKSFDFHNNLKLKILIKMLALS